MIPPLIGLEATLLDDRCDAARLADSAGGAARLYLRQGDEGWSTPDGDADPVHVQDLMAALREGLGGGFDTLECFVGGEKVVYTLARGAVFTRRAAREASERFAEPDRESKPLAEALGIPASKRRPKFRQAYDFARAVTEALPRRAAPPLRLLDCACGRSYLGFVLLDLLASANRPATLHGVDSNTTLVAKCREIAGKLKWTNCAFETADLAAWSAPGEWDAVLSLHGCDTLTDEAIRIGVGVKAPLICVAPCCQHELRENWKDHPLGWTARYGLIEQRAADALTDGFRCLVLEGLGYRVRVVRFTSQETTPKNLLILARLAGPAKPERLAEAKAFMERFNVRPRLAALVEGGRRG
jgi:hypothetical protein